MKFREIGYRLSDAFRLAKWGVIIASVLGGGGVYLYGLGDSEHGRKTIESLGAKVIADKGHPPFGIGGGAGLFSSRFTIETKDGSREDVVVSRGLLARTAITFRNR
ncbi:MAG: hypothetical protein EPN97_02750 [Alphaproteobacteria bacterium]|nr:MAG: hypothetical protein EPN97_02750 [Alphaproteobacteria bacterium]